MGDEEIVNKILGRLGEKAGRATNQNAKIANSFLQSLQELISGETGILKDASIMHAGSAYEGLSVNAEADFDIPLILSGPGGIFLGNNFKIHRERESKLFSLEWKSEFHSEYRYQYNSNGYLSCKVLLKDAFKRLEMLITSLGGWDVEVSRGLVSLLLKIDSGGSTKISMDLSPQIAFRCWECPDLVPLQKLPDALQKYIVQNQTNGSTIFVAPLTAWNTNRVELCNISFSMLEKKFLMEEENVRDIVRLVKLITKCREWKQKKYHFKSFHLKRLAIRHVEQLKTSTKWKGVKLLLNYIYNDLQDNTIEGFFLKNHVIYSSKPTKVDEIRREINEVKKWSPGDLQLQAFGISEISANSGVVNQILGHIDATATLTAKARKKIVDEFLDNLTQLLIRETGILRGATVMHAGSSYEGLVVSHETDFDICIVLASPFSGGNFKVVRDSESKLFRLQWVKIPNESYRKYVSNNGYLKSKLLQSELLDKLKNLIQNVSQKKDWKIEVQKKLVANTMKIKCVCGEVSISMDIAPQIAVRRWECPDIVPLSTLPAGLKLYIERLEANASPIFFYSLDAPKTEKYKNKETLCLVSFSMLEKKFLQENCKIRDMIRLVKVVAFLQDWKKYGLKIFPLKRLAIKHMNELKSLDTWPGYERLLTHLFNDLQDMSIEGFFIHDYNINMRNTKSWKNPSLPNKNSNQGGSYSGYSFTGEEFPLERPHILDRLKTEIHEFRQWDPSKLLNLVYENYDKRSEGGHSLKGSCL